MEKQLRGTVSWFNEARGFGFITVVGPDRTVKTYFLHLSKIERLFPEKIEVGCRALFNPGPKVAGKEFPSALNVDIVWKPEQTPGGAK